MKVLSVIGTRPEAIKMAPVVRALDAANDIESIVCLTGQHREMLDGVISVFGLRVDYDLNLMRQTQTPVTVLSGVLREVAEVIVKVEPDFVLVQGDTMTTFGAALAAYYERVAVGHVEAGLRTGNFDEPFPEEMNRKLVSNVATLNFAPTHTARQKLLAEGYDERRIFVTGNTVVDAMIAIYRSDYRFVNRRIAEFINTWSDVVLATSHRRENIGERMEAICDAIEEIAESHPSVGIVFPVHPNPQVQQIIHRKLASVHNILLTDALTYPDFVNLLGRARLVLTDSGGVQEEAPSLNVPVLIMRETTERMEGVETGAARLVGTSKDGIVQHSVSLLEDSSEYARMCNAENPYGNGTAAKQIVEILRRNYSSS